VCDRIARSGELWRKCVKKGGTLEVRVGDRKRRRIKEIGKAGERK